MNKKPQITHSYVDDQLDGLEGSQNRQLHKQPLAKNNLMKYGTITNMALLFFGAGWS